jgi:uncharacterized protein (TIGR03118 family)
MSQVRHSVLQVFLTSLILPQGLFAGGSYQVRSLVSSGPEVPAEHQDSHLVNAWGLAAGPTSFMWVADNGTGVSTLYDGSGNAQQTVVAVPAGGSGGQGNPTGIVFNPTGDFEVKKDAASAPSLFLFATESGAISGWAPSVDAANAIVGADLSGSAIFKGLALGSNGSQPLLYATDFHNGAVDVFDGSFKKVDVPGGFRDRSLPRGFAPFGIQNLNGDIYVTYAKQDKDQEDDVAGKGLGFVDVFDPDGRLIRRVASRGRLNSPWGLAIAPAGFGKQSNRLLVGNFGDGTINVFDLHSGESRGRLRDDDGKAIRIDGLWGLRFGNGFRDQPVNTLFFSAGPDDESKGLYGRIEPTLGGKKAMASGGGSKRGHSAGR